MRDPEYDRFGPWVIEISELDPLPPLFQPYLTRDEIPLLSIKIERRKAHPGMNLYDYVVSLYQEELLILERVGDAVRLETFLYRDIQCLRYRKSLLKGNLHLVMPGKVFDLPFNTVSEDIMQRLVDLIRQQYTNTDRNEVITQNPDIVENDLSFYFTRLLTGEKNRHPELQVLASQVETPVGRYESGIFRKILFGVFGKMLLESLHLSDGRELKIINRGQTYRYKKWAIYTTEYFYFPVRNIVDVTWEADSENTNVVNLILATAGDSFSFAFVQDNPFISSYARFLSDMLAFSVELSVN